VRLFSPHPLAQRTAEYSARVKPPAAHVSIFPVGRLPERLGAWLAERGRLPPIPPPYPSKHEPPAE